MGFRNRSRRLFMCSRTISAAPSASNSPPTLPSLPIPNPNAQVERTLNLASPTCPLARAHAAGILVHGGARIPKAEDAATLKRRRAGTDRAPLPERMAVWGGLLAARVEFACGTFWPTLGGYCAYPLRV